MKEQIDTLIEDSKNAVLFLKRKLNTTKSINEMHDVAKYIEINQENIIYLAEMLKDISTVKENVSDKKISKLFKQIGKNVERSYQI